MIWYKYGYCKVCQQWYECAGYLKVHIHTHSLVHMTLTANVWSPYMHCKYIQTWSWNQFHGITYIVIYIVLWYLCIMIDDSWLCLVIHIPIWGWFLGARNIPNLHDSYSFTVLYDKNTFGQPLITCSTHALHMMLTCTKSMKYCMLVPLLIAPAPDPTTMSVSSTHLPVSTSVWSYNTVRSGSRHSLL